MKPNKYTRRMDLYNRLAKLGFTTEEADKLRRIEKTLHRWAELECGDSNEYASWAIERAEEDYYVCKSCDARHYAPVGREAHCNCCDKSTRTFKVEAGKPFMVRHSHQIGGRITRTPIADRERGALKRLEAIVATVVDRLNTESLKANGYINPLHYGIWFYHQTDPRGCALYVGRKSDLRPNQELNSCYSSAGVAVCD